jgi:hypothetical protein
LLSKKLEKPLFEKYIYSSSSVSTSKPQKDSKELSLLVMRIVDFIKHTDVDIATIASKTVVY